MVVVVVVAAAADVIPIRPYALADPSIHSTTIYIPRSRPICTLPSNPHSHLSPLPHRFFFSISSFFLRRVRSSFFKSSTWIGFFRGLSFANTFLVFSLFASLLFFLARGPCSYSFRLSVFIHLVPRYEHEFVPCPRCSVRCTFFFLIISGCKQICEKNTEKERNCRNIRHLNICTLYCTQRWIHSSFSVPTAWKIERLESPIISILFIFPYYAGAGKTNLGLLSDWIFASNINCVILINWLRRRIL